MHNEYTSVFSLFLESRSNYKLEQNNIGKELIVLVRMFEIVNVLTNSSLRNKNFASLNSNLLGSAHNFWFEVLFTKNYISQVSVEGF